MRDTQGKKRTATAEAVMPDMGFKDAVAQKTVGQLFSFSSAWLCSFLGSRQLRTGAFLCMMIGVGFFCSGLIALSSAPGLTMAAGITLLGGGGVLMALGIGGYATGLFNRPKPSKFSEDTESAKEYKP